MVMNGRSALLHGLHAPARYHTIHYMCTRDCSASPSPHSTGSTLGLLVASPSSLKSTLTPISFLNNALSLVPSRM